MHICQDEILPIIIYLGPIATMLWLSLRARVRHWLKRSQHTHCIHPHHDDKDDSHVRRHHTD